MTTHTTRMLILGSGPAGLSAAIYGARAGMQPIVVQGIQPGGQLTTTTDVENYPGFADVIQGPWLMEQMQKQAEHVGTRLMWDTIVEVDLSKRPFRLIGDGGDVYEGEVLVIATGAQAKWLGIESEEPMKGKGVSACATCDGFFYRGKKVAVIGGGNTAVEEALYLTNHSDDVTLIHRRGGGIGEMPNFSAWPDGQQLPSYWHWWNADGSRRAEARTLARPIRASRSQAHRTSAPPEYRTRRSRTGPSTPIVRPTQAASPAYDRARHWRRTRPRMRRAPR